MNTRLTLICAMLSFAGLLAGCGASFARTEEERVHNWNKIQEAEFGMAIDDIDDFLLAERRSRLTKWH